MFEPHLELAIPSTIALLSSTFRAGSADAMKIIILQQAFDNEQSQTYIRDICLAAYHRSGVRLFMIEGTSGGVTVPSEARDIRRMMKTHFEVSAGVLAAAGELSGQVRVLGVDEPRQHQVARHAQDQLNTSKPIIESVFRRIAGFLRRAQRRVYPGAVIRMQRARLSIYGSNPDSRHRFKFVRRAARVTDANLHAFRLMLKADEILLREQGVSQERVKAEKDELTSGLVRHFADSWEQVAKNGDLKSFLPYIEFWLGEIGRSATEFERDFKRNPGAVLGECRFWLEAWIASMGHDMRDGTRETSAILEELMRLAIRVRFPFFHLLNMRRWVAQQRDTWLIGEAIAQNANAISDCCEPAEAIIDAMKNPRASAFCRLEERLNLLRRALLMELSPLEAARLEIAPGSLMRLAGEVATEVGLHEPATPDVQWEQAEIALGYTRHFYEACLERSSKMAARTLHFLRQRGHDRAVLAVGGFHPDVIRRHFENDRRVSFSIVTPIPSLPPS